MITRALATSAVLLTLVGCSESLIELGGEPSTNLNEGDNAFFKKISLSNMTEIDSSRLALTHSENASVQAFAQRMIDDHSKAGQEVSDLSVSKGVILPVELDSLDQIQIDSLTAKNGKEFDRAYIDMQVNAQKQAINIDQDEADNGIDKDTRTLASKLLDTLKTHLTMAQQIQSSL